MPEADWVNLGADTLQAVSSTASLAGSESLMVLSSEAPLGLPGTPTPYATTVAGAVTDEERSQYEKERAKLFAQLDEKVRMQILHLFLCSVDFSNST